MEYGKLPSLILRDLAPAPDRASQKTQDVGRRRPVSSSLVVRSHAEKDNRLSRRRRPRRLSDMIFGPIPPLGLLQQRHAVHSLFTAGRSTRPSPKRFGSPAGNHL